MKQIDFSKLEIEKSIGVFECIDVRKDLGNMIFASANTIELDQLSRKVFNAPCEAIELNDAEYGLLMQVLRNGCARYNVIQAIEMAAKE